MRTLAKGRTRELGTGVPRLSEWERAEWTARAERAGFRPRERCECDEPVPGFGGGDRFYITRICCTCSRRLRPSEDRSA